MESAEEGVWECSEKKSTVSHGIRNVDIAIKGTVWISQGVPCPVSIVMCHTEHLGSQARSGLCVSEGRLSGRDSGRMW